LVRSLRHFLAKHTLKLIEVEDFLLFEDDSGTLWQEFVELIHILSSLELNLPVFRMKLDWKGIIKALAHSKVTHSKKNQKMIRKNESKMQL
jgi:hypothetical protein